jgi:carbon-monoxide dehydrogenase medium subunit/xanthine dehydrogenase FAD-binding subunit
MIPELNYYCPATVGEAVALLQAHENTRILAGGTDVIGGIRLESSRFKNVAGLVDINGIAELREITETADTVTIGAAVTFAEITQSKICRKYYPALVSASSQVGSPQIRNRATVAGNFVNNAPCADSVPSLLVYDAVITIVSASGTKEMPLSDFLLKPYRTQITSDALVTKVTLKKFPESYQSSFYKLGRRRAVVISRMTICLLGESKDGIITDARVATGAATPIGKRVPEIEAFLKGKPVADDTFREAGVMLGTHILNATGLRWSTPYKLPVAQNLCYQELSKLFSR